METIVAHNVNVVGSGEQHVLLAHGFGTDQSVWRYLVPYLLDDYRVVLFDQMGAGSTNPDHYDFQRYSTLDGHAFDVLAILETLQIQSCIYVGHSVSAAVGIIASIYRPDLFSKLVLLGASPWYMNDADYYGGFQQEEIDQLFEAMRRNYSAWCSGFAPLVVGGDLSSAAMQEYSRTLFNTRPDIASSLVTTIFTSDIRPLLGLVTVPCHIIQTRHDSAVPLTISDYLRQNLGGDSVAEVIESEGHIPHLSSPGIAIPVILKHIRPQLIQPRLLPFREVLPEILCSGGWEKQVKSSTKIKISSQANKISSSIFLYRKIKIAAFLQAYYLAPWIIYGFIMIFFSQNQHRLNQYCWQQPQNHYHHHHRSNNQPELSDAYIYIYY